MKKFKSKIFVIRRKKILNSFLFLILAGVIWFSVKPSAIEVFNSSYTVSANKRKLPIYCVQTEEKNLSISFDAAWGADDTDKLLQILKDNDVKATFFLCGYWVDKYPEEVKKIAAAGHDIGNHSNTHPHVAQLSKEENQQEIMKAHEKVKKLTNIDMILFRPPFGEYNDTVIDAAREINYYPIQWDVDSLDWKGISAHEIASRVTSKAKNGSIVLFHNNSDNILHGLTMVLEFFKCANKQIVPIGELIYYENFKINNQGLQILQ